MKGFDFPGLNVVRLTAQELRTLTDEELLRVLNCEREGLVPAALQQAINAELLRRHFERARVPHWTQTPGFWVSVMAAILAAVAAVASVLALPQVQRRLDEGAQPVPAASSPAQRAAGDQPRQRSAPPNSASAQGQARRR